MSKRNILRIVIGAGVLLFVSGASLIVALSILLKRGGDFSKVEDSDLQLPERIVDATQNPYPELRNFVLGEDRLEKAKLAIGKYPRRIENPENTKTILRDFALEIGKFDQFARMDDWKLPGNISYHDSYPELSSILAIAKLKGLQTRELLRSNEIDKAIGNAALLIRFGKNMQNAQGSTIFHLSGTVIRGIGMLGILETIDHADLNLSTLESIEKLVDEAEYNPDSLANSLRVEYHYFCKVVDGFASGKLDLEDVIGYSDKIANRFASNRYFFKENRTKQIYADCISQAISEISIVRKASPRKSSLQIEELKGNLLRKLWSGNGVGHILIIGWAPFGDWHVDTFAQNQARRQLLRLRIAMEHYRLKTGEWPADLDALVPHYIDSVPIDPMDGKPLRFHSGNRKIYSVGQDYIDRQGETANPVPMRDKNEIVITLPAS